MLCGSFIEIWNLANHVKKNETKNIRPLVFSFSPIDLAFWWFLFCFFMWFARFQISINEPQSIWRKLLVLSWLYFIIWFFDEKQQQQISSQGWFDRSDICKNCELGIWFFVCKNVVNNSNRQKLWQQQKVMNQLQQKQLQLNLLQLQQCRLHME